MMNGTAARGLTSIGAVAATNDGMVPSIVGATSMPVGHGPVVIAGSVAIMAAITNPLVAFLTARVTAISVPETSAAVMATSREDSLAVVILPMAAAVEAMASPAVIGAGSAMAEVI